MDPLGRLPVIQRSSKLRAPKFWVYPGFPKTFC